MHPLKLRCLLLVVLSAVSSIARAQSNEGYIWIEGENPTSSQITKHGWYDDVKKGILSGNDWLSHFNQRQEGKASYRFRIDVAGTYAFWIRANPVAAKLSYRIDDDGYWQPIDMRGDLRGQINIASDNKPDLRFVAWKKVADLKLSQGQHTLAFRMHSGPQNHGAIDCFVLTRIPFVPSGATKPKESGPAGPDDWFPLIVGDDSLADNSVTDLSHLVASPAGELGFLQQAGDTIRFENAQTTVKFWGINASPQRHWSEADMKRAARWYRKHGINVVRQHTVLDAVGLLDERGEFDRGKLDAYDRWFATLKEEGIYTTWSVIYPHHGRFLQSHDPIDPALYAELDQLDDHADGSRQPVAVNDFINLDESLQKVAWNYFDKLLNHVNPHTGLAYKNDPALAIVEFQNESNLFFFTLNVLLDGKKAPILSRKMRQAFFQFVERKYKTKQAVEKAWSGKWFPQDNWSKGELQLMGAHHWGSEGPLYEFQSQDRRAGDYIQFLAKMQFDYYQKRETQLRQAGFRGVTVTTAWKSGGPAASMANLYSDAVAGMIDRHNYFGGGDGGHRITEGKVNAASHLANPGHGLLSLGLFQVENRPFAVSEWMQMAPNPWKAEAVPLIGFYGMGLQGWDASYCFAMNSLRMSDGWHNLSKYVVETPHYLGQFPAIAFALHHGHIQEGDVIAARKLSPKDVFSGKDVLGQSLSGGSFDSKELQGRLTTPPSALAIGKVTIGFGDQSRFAPENLTPFHDESQRILRSTSGQLVWDYGQRKVEIRTDKTQGVVGFVSSPVELPSVTIRCSTPFVSLLFTPLDNEPLEQSNEILITAMARDKQTGTEYSSDQSRLLAVGGPPLLMEPVQATLDFRGKALKEVKPLNFYGVPKTESIPLNGQHSFTIDGRYQTYYYLVTR